MRIRERLGWFGLAALLAMAPAVRAQERQRQVRAGNTNLLLLGGGYDRHDHPNYDSRPIVDISLAKRVFRREVPYPPLWVRASVNFSALDHTGHDEYGIWPTPLPGLPSPDKTLKQRTSDFIIRCEFMGDLLHTQHTALYGAGGFALHYLNFSSGGQPYTQNFPFSSTESKIAPSLVVGGRLFAVKMPVTGYAEVHYGRAYGRIDVPKSQLPLLDDDFQFTSVNAVALVGGLGLHW